MMTLTEMYAKVAHGTPVLQQEFLNTRFETAAVITPPDEARFFSAYEDSVNELITLYPPEMVFNKDTGRESPKSDWYADGLYYKVPTKLSDDNVVKPLYNTAIIHNIQFMCGMRQDFDKTEFVRLSRSAYHAYWSENAKGRRIKRLRW